MKDFNCDRNNWQQVPVDFRMADRMNDYAIWYVHLDPLDGDAFVQSRSHYCNYVFSSFSDGYMNDHTTISWWNSDMCQNCKKVAIYRNGICQEGSMNGRIHVGKDYYMEYENDKLVGAVSGNNSLSFYSNDLQIGYTQHVEEDNIVEIVNYSTSSYCRYSNNISCGTSDGLRVELREIEDCGKVTILSKTYHLGGDVIEKI